jgi:formate-dependent nitrite reductase membrane component NrfD
MRRLAIITLPVAGLVHSDTAWILGLLVARPFWHTPLLAPMFITSALVSHRPSPLLTAVSWDDHSAPRSIVPRQRQRDSASRSNDNHEREAHEKAST